MTKEQAYHNFVSGFAWKAYDENTVPDDAVLPRITYNLSIAEFGDPVAMSISLWERSYSWEDITLKADEIYQDIGFGGKLIPYDGGSIWIRRGTPFSLRMSDPDDTVRRIVINVVIEFLTSN